MTAELQRQATGHPASSSVPLKFHPPTFKQKVALAGGLILGLCVIVVVWAWSVIEVDRHLHNETRIAWTVPDSRVLLSGPPNFWYDPDRHELAYVGTMDAKQKSELLSLFPIEAGEKSTDIPAAYRAAIDALAYKANQNLYGALLALLALGALSGAMGVQLRSFTAFVGNSCYTQKLDVTVWWPYYVVRPFTGLILGIVVVVIVQAGFLAVGNGPPSGTLWWVSVAILAGYSDDEFTQKLRQLSKAIFGEKSSAPKNDVGGDGVNQGAAAAGTQLPKDMDPQGQ
jgi:hypothetical protein